MQTILGAGGPIGNLLARELHRSYTKKLRLVSRNPQKLHDSDEIMAADLTDFAATLRAVEGSKIVYVTVGLPMNTDLWEKQYVLMIKNAMEACKTHQAKMVFFDNTYMYPKTAEPQTEKTPFLPAGRKSEIRAEAAQLLLDEIEKGSMDIMICRAPEFYGPQKTKSITHSFILNNIKQGKQPKVLLNDATRRTLIWTPDASSAMALLANTPDAYGETWHLPCDDHRITYREMIEICGEVTGKKTEYTTLTMEDFVNDRSPQAKELMELLPRYEVDHIFISDKIKRAFSRIYNHKLS